MFLLWGKVNLLILMTGKDYGAEHLIAFRETIKDTTSPSVNGGQKKKFKVSWILTKFQRRMIVSPPLHLVSPPGSTVQLTLLLLCSSSLLLLYPLLWEKFGSDGHWNRPIRFKIRVNPALWLVHMDFKVNQLYCPSDSNFFLCPFLHLCFFKIYG